MSERCEFGHLLHGVVVIPINEQPSHVIYCVEVDCDWRTRTLHALVETPTQRNSITLSTDGEGFWETDAGSRERLAGCIDVDLGCTPSTNTLPIRRLHLAIGESQALDVAYLRFPELKLERATQRYERLADRRWRYRSGRFRADLHVDSHGYVTRYGNQGWVAIARAELP